jgi:hypothetical protein
MRVQYLLDIGTHSGDPAGRHHKLAEIKPLCMFWGQVRKPGHSRSKGLPGGFLNRGRTAAQGGTAVP